MGERWRECSICPKEASDEDAKEIEECDIVP